MFLYDCRFLLISLAILVGPPLCCHGDIRDEIPRVECLDESPRCIKLAAKGDCRTNPAYMSLHCSRSCGFCDDVAPSYAQREVNTPKRTLTKLVMWAFVVVSLTITLKTYFGGKYNTSSTMLQGITAVITGANAGIGKETALDLARRGASIIIGCRDEEKSRKTIQQITKETGNKKLVFIRLDLSSFQSVRDFAEQVKDMVDNVNILINNAGTVVSKFSETADGHEKTFQVNYLSHFLLTELLMEKLKDSAPSRIINVSSDAHLWCSTNDFSETVDQRTFNSWSAYCKSKMAQVMYTREAARRLQGSGVSVFVVHPGTVRTEISRNFDSLKYNIISTLLTPLAYVFLKSPLQGAQTTIHCSVERDIEDFSGSYFKECTPCDCNKRALDEDACRDLWRMSQLWTDSGMTQ